MYFKHKSTSLQNLFLCSIQANVHKLKEKHWSSAPEGDQYITNRRSDIHDIGYITSRSSKERFNDAPFVTFLIFKSLGWHTCKFVISKLANIEHCKLYSDRDFETRENSSDRIISNL